MANKGNQHILNNNDLLRDLPTNSSSSITLSANETCPVTVRPIPSQSSSLDDSISLQDSKTPVSEVLSRPDSPFPRTNSEPRLYNSSFSYFWHHWKWEAIAGLFNFAIPLIIIATLLPHAEDPLPQWPFHISINALLSIYAIVFRACLTFLIASCIGQLQWSWFLSDRPLYDVVRYDNAGQGPWGSLQLLWTQNIKHPLTAFGAVILIAGVALDPFIQQLTSPVGCSMALRKLNGTLPRTNNITEDQLSLIDVRSPISSAITTIAYSPSSIMSWDCLTGNCTFSETHGTIGYCSTCEDRSADILFNTTCVEGVFGMENFGICPEGTGMNLTSTIISDGPFRYLQATNMTFNYVFEEVSYPVMLTASSSPAWIQSKKSDLTSYKQSGGFESVILAGKTSASNHHMNLTTAQHLSDCDTTETRNTWRCRGYGAAVCTLQPCVRIYNATIVNTNLEERLVSTSGSISWGATPPNASVNPNSITANNSNQVEFDLPLDSYWYGIVNTFCISVEDKRMLEQIGYEIDMSSQWLSVGTLGNDHDFRSDLLKRNCLYQTDANFMLASMAQVFQDNLQAEIVAKGVQGSPNTWNWSFSDFSGPPLFQEMFNNGNMDFERIESAFTNISNSLTAWIRVHGNDTYSEPVTGTVFQYATCLRVNWKWLAFPVILAFFSLLFLILVVITTVQQQTPVWKASPLAWIMRGPSFFNASRSITTPTTMTSQEGTLDTMEKISKNITINLIRGSGAEIQLVSIRDEK